MQFSVKLVTRPRPGARGPVLITVVVIVIVTVAAWAGYGPAAVLALFAGGGLLTQAAARPVTGSPQ